MENLDETIEDIENVRNDEEEVVDDKNEVGDNSGNSEQQKDEDENADETEESTEIPGLTHPKPYSVITHSGREIDVMIDDFNAKEYEQKLNDDHVNVIEIGGVIFSRIDIKMIIPV